MYLAAPVSNLLQYSREPAPQNIAGKLAVGFIIAAIPLAAGVFQVNYNKKPLILLSAIFCAFMAVVSGIWSARRKLRNRRRGAWIVIPIALIELVSLFTIVLASDPLGRPRDCGSTRNMCSSNMRQILLAVVMYANDHDGQFPPSLDVLLTTEDIEASVFLCPQTNLTPAPGATAADQAASMRADPGHYLSYIYLGHGLSNDPSVPLQIVLYEPLSEHGDGINVGYSDGFVTWMNRQQAIAAINAAVSAAATRPTTLPSIQGEHR